MTDEEYERLKVAEKEHLRTKKRLRSRLQALKKRKRSESIVQKMKDGAHRLLQETESLIDTLRAQIAGNRARLEHMADEADIDDLAEADAELREERAESLIRQYKAASGRVTSRDRTNATTGSDDDTAESARKKGPEKTIGRMWADEEENTSDSSN